MSRLRNEGHRQTLLRTAVLSALGGAAAHRRVDVLCDVIAGRGLVVDQSAVLRTVADLHELRVLCIVRAPTGRVFGLARPIHHHGVCTSCAEVTELSDEDLGPAVLEAARRTGFEIADGGLQLNGRCTGCGVS